MQLQSAKFLIWYKGPSHDLRTNKWSVQCKKCKRGHEPKTTMIKTQDIECACGEQEMVNWNDQVDRLQGKA